MVAEFGLQHLIIMSGSTSLGKALFGVEELTRTEQMICWVIGASSLVINLVVKKISVDKFAFIESINLERSNPSEFINVLMSWFESQQSRMKVAIEQEQQEIEEKQEQIEDQLEGFMANAFKNVLH